MFDRISMRGAPVCRDSNSLESCIRVQGITFHTLASTDYDDGLDRFEDLQVGQKVEVDFEYRDGRHIATEIELDD